MAHQNDRVFVDRYVLDVQVSSTTGAPVWRAFDNVLQRWVSILFVQDSDPRSSGLSRAARQAAANDSRNVLAVLDVIEGAYIQEVDAKPVGPVTGIISEWTDSPTINELLISQAEPFSIEHAVDIIHSIAQTLVDAHSLGLTHGRLRPHSIHLLDDSNTQISGFGIDSSLLGSDSKDGIDEDIRGLGNLLFALVTGVWPHSSVDGLPGAKMLTGQEFSLPSAIHNAVSEQIDALYVESQNGAFRSVRGFIEALAVTTANQELDTLAKLQQLTTHTVHWRGGRSNQATRARGVLIASAVVVAMGWFGWQLMTRNYFNSEAPPGVLSPNSSAALISGLPALTGAPSEIASATDFDPFGDLTENPQKVHFAYDADKKTAWRTVQYKQSSLGGKQGVGILLDLGKSQRVISTEILFTEVGNSVEIYVSDTKTPDFATSTKLGSKTAGSIVTIVKNPDGVTGRYVLVWLTGITKTSNGTFQAGIANVRVLL